MLEFHRGVVQPEPSHPKYLKEIPAHRSIFSTQCNYAHPSIKNIFCQIMEKTNILKKEDTTIELRILICGREFLLDTSDGLAQAEPLLDEILTFFKFIYKRLYTFRFIGIC